MDGLLAKIWIYILLVFIPVVIGTWKTSQEERRQARELRRGGIHYHSKRHMLPTGSESKRRTSTPKSRDIRKKPSGHLTPLQEDDMDNDEVISVAIGPPPMRPKYDKLTWKHMPKAAPAANNSTNCSHGASMLVKNVLTELGREFLTHQVNEDFVFGQYVGNAMRNLTSDLRLKMQHEILELVVKYQKQSREPNRTEEKTMSPMLKDLKLEKKLSASNDTDEGWPDFNNLARIVG